MPVVVYQKKNVNKDYKVQTTSGGNDQTKTKTKKRVNQNNIELMKVVFLLQRTLHPHDAPMTENIANKILKKTQKLCGFDYDQMLQVLAKFSGQMKSEELCARKTKFVLKHMSTVWAEFVFRLCGDHLTLFGHQTFQAPKIFVHNQCHEVSDFVCYLF